MLFIAFSVVVFAADASSARADDDVPPVISVGQSPSASASGADDSGELNSPRRDDNRLLRALLLRDYNTRVVLLGTTLLGMAGGIVGTFMLLRKRSLVGDVVGHASLPGLATAFLVMEIIRPGSGRSFPILLLGALLAGLLGIVCTMLIRRYSRIKDDAALAVVLSIFFGVGVALLRVIQRLPTAHQAGLQHFIFGSAGLMIADDVKLIAGASLVVLATVCLLFKEFALLSFDEEFAAAQGWPTVRLDLLLMLLVAGVTVIGLQSVGLVLMVAMLIIPPAAARFWTNRLGRMTVLSALIGGLSAFLGVLPSAVVPHLATGAVIVLAGSFCFVLSLLFGIERGVVHRWLIQSRSKRRVGRLDLLRAVYELLEPAFADAADPHARELTGRSVAFEQLLAQRTWTPARLRSILSAASREGVVHQDSPNRYRLSDAGAVEARRAVRNHRLWELYLITYADIAPSHVDRDADQIEHVLEPELIDELDRLLMKRHVERAVPESPHPIETVNAGMQEGRDVS